MKRPGRPHRKPEPKKPAPPKHSAHRERPRAPAKPHPVTAPVAGHRSGMVAIIGRPNVGKSTLLNRLVGERLAIVSPKPQTTRNRILGVVTRPGFQLALLDTPGIHQARGEMNRFMVETSLAAIGDVDAVLFMVEASLDRDGKVEIGEGNRFILDRLKQSPNPVILAVNKVDALPDRSFSLPVIDAYRSAFPFRDIFPLSALTGLGTEALVEGLSQALPEGEPLFPPDVFTDQAERTIVGELIREKVLRFCRQEVPYSTAVIIDQVDESERGEEGTKGRLQGLVRIMGTIYVERDSQKAIVIGKGGSMLKRIGTEARRDIERLLAAHVYLELTVRVEPLWTQRPEGIGRMGYVR